MAVNEGTGGGATGGRHGASQALELRAWRTGSGAAVNRPALIPSAISFPVPSLPQTTTTAMPSPPFSATTIPDDYGFRPTTARPPATADYDYPHPPPSSQYPSEYPIEEAYDAESDDDDVFAFLPPSTADQEQQNCERQLDERPNTFFSNYRPPTAARSPDDVAFPSPIYDPYGQGKLPYDGTGSAPASSSNQFSFEYGYPNNNTSPAVPNTDSSRYLPAQKYTLHAPPQSPPSTDSYHQHNDDPYRMKRLDSRTDSVVPPSSPSRNARASLPSSVDDIEQVSVPAEKASVGPDTDIESLGQDSHHHGRQGKIRHGNQNSAPYSHGRLTRANDIGTGATPGTGAASIGPSMDESEIGTSREGSIK